MWGSGGGGRRAVLGDVAGGQWRHPPAVLDEASAGYELDNVPGDNPVGREMRIAGGAFGEVIKHRDGFRVVAIPDAVADGGGGAVGENDASGHDINLPFTEGLDNEREEFGVFAGEACGILVEPGEAGGEDLSALGIYAAGVARATQLHPTVLEGS